MPAINSVALTHSSRRADIEGLRAIAVFLVLVFHFRFPFTSAGFIGVDIFFVISGYLITALLQAEIENTGTVDLVRFYGRRAKRLLPVSFLTIAITLFVAFLILSPAEQNLAAKGAAASSLFAANLWFMTSIFNYFAPESRTIRFFISGRYLSKSSSIFSGRHYSLDAHG